MNHAAPGTPGLSDSGLSPASAPLHGARPEAHMPPEPAAHTEERTSFEPAAHTEERTSFESAAHTEERTSFESAACEKKRVPDRRAAREINDGVRLLEIAGSLRFGTDAYLLSAFVRPAPRARALELGCGSGVISLLLAARGAFREICGLEIQPELVSAARENVRMNNQEHCVTVRQGDLRMLKAVDLGGEFEAVLANPPYMKTDTGFASQSLTRQRARHECDGGIAEFSLSAARCLKYGGRFYTVYRPDRLASLFGALQAAGLTPKRMVFVHDRPRLPACLVLCESVKGAGEGLSLLPPLFLHEEGHPEFSPRAAEIYRTGRFHS